MGELTVAKITVIQQLMLLLLVLIVVASAIGVVYSRYQARSLFVELQRHHKRSDDLAVEWDRLQLEEGTLTNLGAIERKARKQLGMLIPDFKAVEHIRP